MPQSTEAADGSEHERKTFEGRKAEICMSYLDTVRESWIPKAAVSISLLGEVSLLGQCL